jgi:hypothetical protein
MLRISKTQMQVLGEAAERGFRQEMMDHARHFSPRLCATLSPEQLALAVNRAVEGAREVGFTCRGAIRSYLEASILFGVDFAHDPQYPAFATAIDGEGDELTRARDLFDEMNAFIAGVFGRNVGDLHEALANLLRFSEDPPSLSDEGFNDQAALILKTIYKKKADWLGNQAVHALIAHAEDKALALGFTGPRQRMLVVALSFAFGAEFDHDPFYPWIGATLARGKDDEAAVDLRAKSLERKAIIWLRKVVEGNRAIGAK